MDLPVLLETAELTADLYASLSAYTPSQQHSAFSKGAYILNLITAVKKLVRLRLWLSNNYLEYSFWLCRILVIMENYITLCSIASFAFWKLSFLTANTCVQVGCEPGTPTCLVFLTKYHVRG